MARKHARQWCLDRVYRGSVYRIRPHHPVGHGRKHRSTPRERSEPFIFGLRKREANFDSLARKVVGERKYTQCKCVLHVRESDGLVCNWVDGFYLGDERQVGPKKIVRYRFPGSLPGERSARVLKLSSLLLGHYSGG